MILHILKGSSQNIMSALAMPKGPRAQGRQVEKSSTRVMRARTLLERKERVKTFVKNVVVIILDRAEKWTGNSSGTMRCLFPCHVEQSCRETCLIGQNSISLF